ncbi:MAG: class II aldolase/adducin family protein [Chloroflexota bacterium]|nr:class II aldolase/adducin family protein [Chloroflexota bacterium]
MSLDSNLVDLVAMGRKLMDHRMVRGTAGNLSLRWDELCYISPRGARLDQLSVADFVPLNIHDRNTWQLERASLESAMHLACYRARPDIKVVVHGHPSNCIALGCAGLSLKAITPEFYRELGPEVPLLRYYTPTTQELADAVGEAMTRSDAVILRNHGMTLAAPSLEDALARTLMLDEAARIVLWSHAASGASLVLTASDLKRLEELDDLYHHDGPGLSDES